MGYYAKYYSTLFKGLTMTVWKERMEARKAIFILKRGDADLYKKIREQVAKHKVTAALKALDKLVKELKEAADNAEKLLFNEETVDMQILKAEEMLLDYLGQLSRQTGQNKVLQDVERGLAISIYEGTKLAEAKDREQYKTILLILDETGKHRAGFMEATKLMFQKEDVQTVLARFAIRMELRRVKKDVNKLNRAAYNVGVLKDYISNSRKKPDELRQELKKEYEQVKVTLKDAFQQSYLIKKRDLLIVLKILFNLNNLRNFLMKWAEEHNLPSANVQRLLVDIDKLEKAIYKEFQTIAQGMRIIISSIEGIERRAFEQAR